MAYEDVPERMLSGEAVPRSEIIGHFGATMDIQVSLALSILTQAFVLEKVYEDDTVKYRMTSFGIDVRNSLVTRLEGECE